MTTSLPHRLLPLTIMNLAVFIQATVNVPGNQSFHVFGSHTVSPEPSCSLTLCPPLLLSPVRTTEPTMWNYKLNKLPTPCLVYRLFLRSIPAGLTSLLPLGRQRFTPSVSFLVRPAVLTRLVPSCFWVFCFLSIQCYRWLSVQQWSMHAANIYHWLELHVQWEWQRGPGELALNGPSDHMTSVNWQIKRKLMLRWWDVLRKAVVHHILWNSWILRWDSGITTYPMSPLHMSLTVCMSAADLNKNLSCKYVSQNPLIRSDSFGSEFAPDGDRWVMGIVDPVKRLDHSLLQLMTSLFLVHDVTKSPSN